MAITRREFIRTSAIGLMGLTIIPSSYAKLMAPSDTIRMGVIGLGQQAMHLVNGFLNMPGVKLVAGCDVYEIKRDRFKQKVDNFYKGKNQTSDVQMYERFQDVLGRSDIDAVVIATPDHWHASIAIAACKAGKDVYLEKPLTFTITEGKELVKAVRKNKRILQVGSQQRDDIEFQHAVKMVQDGKIGTISNIKAYVGAPPVPYDLPEKPIPAGLNWDLWLGPLPNYIHYNPSLNPPISLNPEQSEAEWGAWRWYKEMGGGFTTDWGAHMFDIAQWGLGKDHSGPVEIIPVGYGDAKYLTYIYDNGTILTEEKFNGDMKGVKFFGTNGWIEVSRGYFKGSSPELDIPSGSKLRGGTYETGTPHLENFIQAVRSRKDPSTPVEVGHRTCSMCTLGNMATDLKRPIKWNPNKEQFIDDKIAQNHSLNGYKYRKGYKLG